MSHRSDNLVFTTTPFGELHISSQAIDGASTEPVAPSTLGLISEYALLNSPNFIGIPTAPTADVSNNSTQIATTAYVQANRAELQANIDLKANINSPVLTGIPEAPTADVSNNSTQIATTAYVQANRAELQANIDLKANINSPVLTGIPKAPTALSSVHDEQIATTEYVYNAINDLIDGAPDALNTLKEIVDALETNDASDNLILNKLLNSISSVDASLNFLRDTKVDKTAFDASHNYLDTIKADKSYVDASLNTLKNTKVDKTAFDASHNYLDTFKADKNYVDAQNNAQNAAIASNLSNIANNFSNVYISINDLTAKNATQDASINILQTQNTTQDASITSLQTQITTISQNGGNNVKLDNSQTITGTKKFYPSNGPNEYGVLGLNSDYTYVGIVGNLNNAARNDWNSAGMDIKSSGVRFYGSYNKTVGAMVNNENGKYWSKSGFYIGDGTVTTNNENIPTTQLQDGSLTSTKTLNVGSSSELNLYSPVNVNVVSYNNDVHIGSVNGNLILESAKNTTVDASNILMTSYDTLTMNSTNKINITNNDGDTFIKSLKGNTILDASQNIYIGTSSQGVIMGEYNVVASNNTVIFPNTTSPGFLTIGKSKNSYQQYGYNYLVGGNPITGAFNTYGSANYSIVAAERIGCAEFNAFSDLRLKENINKIELTEAMNLVKNIDPVVFDWKDNKQQTSGYIAQDILKNGCPKHLVSIIPDNNLEETIDSDNFVSPAGAKFVVNYNGLIPYYHRVIKNLVERIEELEKKII